MWGCGFHCGLGDSEHPCDSQRDGVDHLARMSGLTLMYVGELGAEKSGMKKVNEKSQIFKPAASL